MTNKAHRESLRALKEGTARRRHCVWPTGAPSVNPSFWSQEDWERFEDGFRPPEYAGGRHDREAWLEHCATVGVDVHARLREQHGMPSVPRRYVSVWYGPDGKLRLTVIDQGVPEIPTTRDPEVAQQQYLRYVTGPAGQPVPPENIPLWNGFRGGFDTMADLIDWLEKGRHVNGGWIVVLRSS
jgi:hypothetical protein|tara:strand:- start:2256 stop:2804 length:549 start_codon:yes stop_codon:yes gene_type:complete